MGLTAECGKRVRCMVKRRASSFMRARGPYLSGPAQLQPEISSALWRPDRCLNLTHILQEITQPDGSATGAMSHVAVSFESPIIPPMWMRWARCACWKTRFLGLERNAVSGASTSELYGLVQEIHPKDHAVLPRYYAVAKLYAYWIPSTTVNPAVFTPVTAFCCLTTSPASRRAFVTRRSPAPSPSYRPRDWSPACISATWTRFARLGSCEDYVRMQWMMLRQGSRKTS
ncbi:GDP-mannose 4,6-dehydratase [Salmonella enterica subsp. enterica]|nr:GDP-mannose 4,6-dehydratase [Salmonella enterica subsp. enterica]